MTSPNGSLREQATTSKRCAKDEMGQSAQTKMKNKKRTNNTTTQDGSKEMQLTGPSVTVNLKVSKSESECRAVEVVNIDSSPKPKTISKTKVVLKPEDVSLFLSLSLQVLFYSALFSPELFFFCGNF